jgi:multidrug efflux pump subunit AcrA (membrane-fusion protein)
MKLKTLLTLLCVLGVGIIIGVAGQYYVAALPSVKVYTSRAEIDHAPAAAEIDGISFLKKQQRQVPSRTEPVRVRQTADGPSLAVPESAIVEEGENHVVFVQLAGETFQERRVALGDRADGYVEVLLGLAEDEHVATNGVAAIAESLHEAGVHQHEADVHQHDGEQVVHLTQDDVERYEIEVGAAGPGEVDVYVSLPGQIAVITDRLAHIMPNAVGVVRQVLKNVGDTVRAREVIAWLESSELGKAKVDYLTKWAELGCCSMDLTRAQQISEGTTGLLETLKSSPSLEAIREAGGEALDANHTMLVSAYAELVLARSAYDREKSLFEKKISSEKDYLAAENAFKKADAKYAATRDSIAFEVKRRLLEAQRALQVRQIELKGAERNLYVLGLSTEDINDIQLYAQDQKPGDGGEEDCDDPNCPECAAERAEKSGEPVVASAVTDNIDSVQLVAETNKPDGGEMEKRGDSPSCNCPECAAKHAAQGEQSVVIKVVTDNIGGVRPAVEGHSHGGEVEACDNPNCAECAAERAAQVVSKPLVEEATSQDERLAWYPLRAPFDATVIEKHITLGEKLSDESCAFTVADLSTVWVDLNVYQKDLPFVKPGQRVSIAIGSVAGKVEGRISYVGPIVGEKTRTALARVVLDNASGALRPGTFVTADVLVDKARAKVAVPKAIIQDMDDQPTVFVRTDHGFEPRTVSFGRVNDTIVEITSGLEPGEKIVTKNSFRLKAELEKVAGGAHAGHGHVH